MRVGSLAIRQVETRCHRLAPALDGLRIAHVSDLHIERWTPVMSQLQLALKQEAYDLLVITGDFCQWPSDAESVANYCTRLFEHAHPPLGIYGVLGNHDGEELARQSQPVRLLRNESLLLPTAGGAIKLCGVEQRAGWRGEVRQVITQFDPETFHLVLAHYPSTAYELPAGEGAMMLSGHTHGGQIRIPGLGCIFNNDTIPRAMSRGVHTVQGNWLNVSAGIGASWLLRARVFCPPEISILTLRSTTMSKKRRYRRVRRRRWPPVRQPEGVV